MFACVASTVLDETTHTNLSEYQFNAGNHIVWSFYMQSSISTHPLAILLIIKPLLQFDRTSIVFFHAMSPQQAKKSNLETQAREANMY